MIKKRFFNIGLITFLLLINWASIKAQDTESDILARAEDLVQASKYEKALNLYSFYLRYHPDSVDALSQRAVVYASLDNFTSAFNDINHAFKIAGFSAIQQAMIHNNRGQVYFLEGNHTLALEDFSRAIELHPDMADYWLNRAILYQLLEDWDLALSDYEQFLTIEPQNSPIYLNIARIHLSQANLDATIEALTSAISITPDDPELYIFRGSVNLQRKAFADAANDYVDWLDLINLDVIEQNSVSGNTSQINLDMSYGIYHHIPFEASSGDRLGVVANSATVDSLIVLIDPDGNPIMADDDSGQGLNSFILDFTLPNDGTYTLLVGHARGGWIGEIELTLQIVPAEDI